MKKISSQQTDIHDEFLTNLDDSYRMRSAHWLAEKIKSGSPVVVLDVRSVEGFTEGHIKSSINIPIREMPDRYRKELEDIKEGEIICLCSGSVLSAYAVSFLYAKGFEKLYNLSGGFSRFKEQYPHLVKVAGP